MAGFIQNILWNSVEGFVDAGKRTAGEYAGNALIKAGDLVENAGRSVGNGTSSLPPQSMYSRCMHSHCAGIERKATSYGSALSGQAYQPAPKALPSTARKPAIKRSNSLPTPSKPAGVRTIGPTSKTPIGANKYPGGKQVNGATKRVTNGVGGAKSAVGSATGGVVGTAQKSIGGVTGGVVGGAQKSLGGVTNGASKGLGGITNGASKTLGDVTSNATKTLGGLPSKAPSTATKPNPNPSPAFPSAEKKTPVRPGQPKPFKAPETKKDEQKTAGATPYPGTNTLPGQGGKTPVKRRYTPLPRLGPQVKEGQKMTHIPV